MVGTTTFGKGVFQEVIELEAGGALDLTVGEYLTADGTSILGKGVEPDVEAEDDRRPSGGPTTCSTPASPRSSRDLQAELRPLSAEPESDRARVRPRRLTARPLPGRRAAVRPRARS